MINVKKRNKVIVIIRVQLKLLLRYNKREPERNDMVVVTVVYYVRIKLKNYHLIG